MGSLEENKEAILEITGLTDNFLALHKNRTVSLCKILSGWFHYFFKKNWCTGSNLGELLFTSSSIWPSEVASNTLTSHIHFLKMAESLLAQIYEQNLCVQHHLV